jgi:hypothetical protein
MKALPKLGWLAATVAVAALTARAVEPRRAATADASVAPIARRATTTLTRRTIEPVLSLEGTIRAAAGGGRFEVVAAIEPADAAYRLIHPPLTIRGAIHGGPAGWTCTYIGLEPSTADGPGVALRCAVPRSVTATAGLVATVVAALDEPRPAQALPLSAVVGSAEHGQVVVVDGARTLLRDVRLGRSDAGWIEVLDGLRPGERVLERPTSTDVSAAG